MKPNLLAATSIIWLALSVNAFAVDARGAIKSCDANPKCDYTTSDNGDVVITVGIKTIICPQRGECIVQAAGKTPKGTKGIVSTVAASPESILQSQD